MSEIAKFYDTHLAELRQSADEHKIHFVWVIAIHIKNRTGQTPYGLRTRSMENEKTEERFIEMYRTLFYEQFANLAIKYGGSIIKKSAQTMAKDIAQHAVNATNARDANLKGGQPKGAQKMKDNARIKRARLNKAITDYLENSRSALVNGSKGIMAFLKKSQTDWGYVDSTLERYIKQELTKFRSSSKAGQPVLKKG